MDTGSNHLDWPGNLGSDEHLIMTTFSQIEVGHTFYRNGDQYIKHSKYSALLTRLGKIVCMDPYDQVVTMYDVSE